MAKLEWGQTPWDNLSREQLLREVQRMFAAIEAANYPLNLYARLEGNASFWGQEGTGGRALEMARQILEPIKAEYDSEQIYRSFFRYATDLLFEQNAHHIGHGWAVCPVCNTMWGATADYQSHVGKRCSDIGFTKCDGVLRPLTWDDMKPKARR